MHLSMTPISAATTASWQHPVEWCYAARPNSFALHFAMRSFAAASDGGATQFDSVVMRPGSTSTSRAWAGRCHARRAVAPARRPGSSRRSRMRLEPTAPC